MSRPPHFAARCRCTMLRLGTFARRAAAPMSLAATLMVGPSACSQKGPPWALKDISGLMPPLVFTLTDANTGQLVQARDFRGKLLVVYFGYTHCPDVCPTTLSRLSRAVAALGPQANETRILFVTVDPARDSLADLKRYGPAFGPQVIGLRGTQSALRTLTKRYRVTYGYGRPGSHGEYAVSHSAAVYIFDRHGEARLLARPRDAAAAITKDLARLATET